MSGEKAQLEPVTNQTLGQMFNYYFFVHEGCDGFRNYVVNDVKEELLKIGLAIPERPESQLVWNIKNCMMLKWLAWDEDRRGSPYREESGQLELSEPVAEIILNRLKIDARKKAEILLKQDEERKRNIRLLEIVEEEIARISTTS